MKKKDRQVKWIKPFSKEEATRLSAERLRTRQTARKTPPAVPHK